MDAVEFLGRQRYVLVTTFRRDDTPVATPVWVARDGDHLVVWVGTSSGKAKRVRRNPAVTVAACTIRGKPRSEPVPGRAELVDGAEGVRLRALIKKRYGLQGRIFVGRAERQQPDNACALRITL
jgi:uncharacterized protein